MDLVHDVLDKALRDRRAQPIGRIDGIVVEVDGRRQPRVVAVEVGAVAQARRLGPRIAQWVGRLTSRWGRMKPDPYRFAWSALEEHEAGFRVDVLASEVETRAWERWLRVNVVDRIPGA